MDVKLKTSKLSYLKTICLKNVTREETYEYVIPEPMPDVGEVTAVCGTMLLRSKDPQRGACEITANAELSWIYTSPDDNGVRSLETSVPTSYRAECSNISEACMVIAVPEFISCEARVISSRKVLFKVNSVCRIACYTDKEKIISECPEEDGYECDIMEYKADILKVAEEKPFELSSNFSVAEGRAAEILFWESRLTALKASCSNRRLTFSGKMKLSVAYRDGDSDTPVYIEHTEEFTQTADCAYESINYISAQIAPTSAYVTNEPGLAGDGKSIGFDMGFVIQYTLGQEVNIKCLKDMYSTVCRVACEYEECKLECMPRDADKNLSAVGTVKLVPEAQNYLACSAVLYPLISRDGSGTVSADGSASIVWRDAAGNLYNKYVHINSEAFKPDDDFRPIFCMTEEGMVNPMSGGCEVRIPASLRLEAESNRELNYTSSAEKMENVSETASLWITRADPQMTLWAIGKKHGVSVNTIRSASGLDQTGEPEPGTLLIIPKF